MSQFFESGGQTIPASGSVLPVSILDWFPLGWAGWISLAVQGTLKSLLQHHGSKAKKKKNISQPLHNSDSINCALKAVSVWSESQNIFRFYLKLSLLGCHLWTVFLPPAGLELRSLQEGLQKLLWPPFSVHVDCPWYGRKLWLDGCLKPCSPLGYILRRRWRLPQNVNRSSRESLSVCLFLSVALLVSEEWSGRWWENVSYQGESRGGLVPFCP